MARHSTPLRWDLTPREAVLEQRHLAGLVRTSRLRRDPVLVAGCDMSAERFGKVLHCGVVVVRLADLETVATAAVSVPARFPYVPGLLSFREAPGILDALARIRLRPDVLVLDGHGRAHPRRFGIASHVGVAAGIPSLGCAKSILVGEHRRLGRRRGATAELVHQGETVGRALRTRNGVKPVFVSVGTGMNLDDAVRLCLAMDGGVRIPEPTRRAHILVNEVRRSYRD
jgi:deoxyribonuclease V